MQATSAKVLACLAAAVMFPLSPLPVKAAAPGTGPSFKGPLGLQLYSLRDQFKQDVPNTLDKVKGFGFRYAELAGTYDMPPDKFKTQLTIRGIQAVAGHFPYERFRDDAEGVAREAKALGLKYAGCAWIPHTAPFNEQVCREAIAVFNRAGEALARHGLKFFYHVHGYEFRQQDDGTLMDLMIKETHPRRVVFEMDIFWVVFPKQDPVELLKRYGKRWELMHLKDMRKGLKTGLLTGRTEVTNDVPLGAGQINLVPLLRAAKKAGVKWYFIEDESPSVEQQIPESLRFLEQVKF
jgi:sugar phosphate isomerase/epimerase